MLFTRKIGNAEVSNVIEYSGSTHDPAFLFPDMPREIIGGKLALARAEPLQPTAQ